ncbi:Protein-tyrosine phosphatase/Dual specificity phosphatase, catalytic domain containing protein, putative [Angomonas deanei]|uniref:Protein-tyrosine phosphatase/Dual specificity phosphatase, catalytic domain containing protein, putative n=1 Tax=Angomonas deanei TaxID=59799 RepID=A0A7G2CBT3_9TRYP|nr:Protein-tyrosine phosphatase/Dual specificity phosphatase, catalytic domain containing protein, putative [Angomonas deanei]
MLADVDDTFVRPPKERTNPKNFEKLKRETKKDLRVQTVDQSKQDSWLDRARQGLHCSVFCGGVSCKHEDWDMMNLNDKKNVAIEGLNSNWVGEYVIASQRPSTSLFVKYPLIQKFKENKVTGVLNLQEKGEHSHCGPDGVYESSGYSYNGPEDLMPHGISYYEFPWPDMTAPEQDVVLRSVQVMDYHVSSKGKVLVHCHAGLGRTGLMIACYYVYSRHIPSSEAIELVRQTRPGAIQTERQAQFVHDFEKHIWRLGQAFRVEISDALIDVNLFIQRQRLILHGEKGDLYRCVPMFLHKILCRLIQITRKDPEKAKQALQSLRPSFAPDEVTLSKCRIYINRRRFKVQSVDKVELLSFLVCDWFRAMASPALSVEDCDKIVEYKRNSVHKEVKVINEIRNILTKPVRHTIGMVISAYNTIASVGVSETIQNDTIRCLVDSFNHAFNPVKLRHSPIEREFMHSFFVEWGDSVRDIYFKYDPVLKAHRTIERIALASSIVLENLDKQDVDVPALPRRLPRPFTRNVVSVLPIAERQTTQATFNKSQISDFDFDATFSDVGGESAPMTLRARLDRVRNSNACKKRSMAAQ